MPRDDDEEEFKVRGGDLRTQRHSTGRSCLVLPSGLPFWKPSKENSSTIDIIPYKCGPAIKNFLQNLQFAEPGEWYGERTYFTHRDVGVNRDLVACPARNFGHKCPICEEVKKLDESTHKDDQKKAQNLRARERQLFLVYDHDQKERKVQLWEISQWNFGKQLTKYIDGARAQDRKRYQVYYHPFEGYSMRITPSKESMGEGKPNTIWSIHAFYARENPLEKTLFKHGYDLDTMPRAMEYNDLKAIFRGEVDVPSSGIDDDEDEQVSVSRDERHGERDEKPPARDERREERAASPPPPPEPVKQHKFASKDIVEFTFAGRSVKGEIESVDYEKGTANVVVPGAKRAVTMEFDELTLVKSDTTFDQKPAPAQDKASRTSEWDDTEPDDRTKKPRKKKE